MYKNAVISKLKPEMRAFLRPLNESSAPTKTLSTLQSTSMVKLSALPDISEKNNKTITEKDIAWLWVCLSKAFGHKFVSNYGEKDNGVWFAALKDLTKGDLEYGFKNMLENISEKERKNKEAWPPNVKEYRMFCERRLEDFNLPSVHLAFREVQNSYYLENMNWSHPLVANAKYRMNLPKGTYVDVAYFYRFEEIYKELCWRFMRGEAICLMEEK